MRSDLRFLFKTALALLVTAVSSAANAVCSPFFVNGNEAEAPQELAAAFTAQDWERVQSLLTDDVQFSFSGFDPKLVMGKRNALLELQRFDRLGRDEMVRGNTAHLSFSPMKLLPSHWVTTTATQVTARPLLPGMFTDAPRLNISYTVTMMPDCEGKVRTILVIDNVVTAHG